MTLIAMNPLPSNPRFHCTCLLQDEPVSQTVVDQAFEEVLPWERWSLRLYQKDIPKLPQILAAFPDDAWRALRRNLACIWPRVLWLNPDNEAPGFQTAEEAKQADATSLLGDQGYLSRYDALESIIHILGRRVARKQGITLPPFQWRTPARSCAQLNAIAPEQIRSTPPLSDGGPWV